MMVDSGFEQFVERERDRLVAVIALFTGEPAIAEDLAQEALVRLWSRWGTSRMPERPQAWVTHVGLNLARSWFRRREAAARALLRLGRSEATWMDPDSATALTVRQWLCRLPPRQRHAVLLRHFADLDVAETSELMGCATGTVKALTHQAVAQLKAIEQMEVNGQWKTM